MRGRVHHQPWPIRIARCDEQLRFNHNMSLDDAADAAMPLWRRFSFLAVDGSSRLGATTGLLYSIVYKRNPYGQALHVLFQSTQTFLGRFQDVIFLAHCESTRCQYTAITLPGGG
jgi:hypothetical protein